MWLPLSFGRYFDDTPIATGVLDYQVQEFGILSCSLPVNFRLDKIKGTSINTGKDQSGAPVVAVTN